MLEYYFQGTPSWQWYYPHHFSPFASDFTDLASLDIDFTLGAPFRPYEQLMGVFPAARCVSPSSAVSLPLEGRTRADGDVVYAVASISRSRSRV